MSTMPKGQHLKSFNYNKYAPDCFLIEDLTYYDKNKDFMDFRKSDLYSFYMKKLYCRHENKVFPNF
jgi:hypothetical protein